MPSAAKPTTYKTQRDVDTTSSSAVKRRRISNDNVSGTKKKKKNEPKQQLSLLQALLQEEGSILDRLWDDTSFAHLPSAQAFFRNVERRAEPAIRLPRTVSLTDLASSIQNGEQKPEEKGIVKEDSFYGWFMDLEDGKMLDTLVGPYAKSGSDLAFSAATAPKRSTSNLQEQVEWAQAADTVDDVLGGLF